MTSAKIVTPYGSVYNISRYKTYGKDIQDYIVVGFDILCKIVQYSPFVDCAKLKMAKIEQSLKNKKEVLLKYMIV